MPREAHALVPRPQQYLADGGENIRLTRLRRKLSAVRIAERAAISRTTLLAIEKGSPAVSIGHYLQVLLALGLEKTILGVAEDDALGRKLQDAELLVWGRAPKSSGF